MDYIDKGHAIELIYFYARTVIAHDETNPTKLLHKVEQKLGIRLTGPQWAATGKMAIRFGEEVQLLASHLTALRTESQPIAHNDNIPRRFRKDIDD